MAITVTPAQAELIFVCLRGLFNLAGISGIAKEDIKKALEEEFAKTLANDPADLPDA